MELQDIKLVELELFSYCNRKCEWCPNSLITRNRDNQILSEDIFRKLIDELSMASYSQTITFSRYNEPMSHLELIMPKIKYIKSKLPNVKLISNTNGDYLTEENLINFAIDELTIMDYDIIGLKKGIKKLESLNIKIDIIEYPYIYGHYNNTQILYYIDWPLSAKIVNRGGELKQYSKDIRINKCYQPSIFVGINYDGTISPCAEIRNDTLIGKNFTLGNLQTNTLYEILNNNKAILFRNECQKALFKKDSPCYMCGHMKSRYCNLEEGSIHYE